MNRTFPLFFLAICYLATASSSATAQSKISWDTTWVQGEWRQTVYGAQTTGVWIRNNDTALVQITSFTSSDTAAWKTTTNLAIDSIVPFYIQTGDSVYVRFLFAPKDTTLFTATFRATTVQDTIYMTLRGRGDIPGFSFRPGIYKLPTQVTTGIPDTFKLHYDPRTVLVNAGGADSLYLFFRFGGDTTFWGWSPFQRVGAETADEYYMSLVPSSLGFSASSGFEVVIRLRIGPFVVTYPNNGYAEPLELTAILPEGLKRLQPQLIGTTHQEYRMISVPCYPDNEDPAVVLSNFGVSDTTWKLMTWRNGDYIDSKSAGFPSMRPGRGYWFITKVLDTLRTGPARSTPIENFGITLIPGWNMIGCPFDFPVSWNDVTNAPVGEAVYSWSGDNWPMVNQLTPWEGYFIYNPDPFNNLTISMKPKRASATRSSFSFAKPLGAGEWRMRVLGQSGWMKDTYNFLGVYLDAEDGIDAHDSHDAPRHPGREYLQVRSLTGDGEALASDIRSASGDHTWDIAVDVLSDEGTVRLDFEEWHSIDAASVYLFDPQVGLAQNIRNVSTYTMTVPKGRATHRQLKIAVGSTEYVRDQGSGIPLVPERFHLYGNYPNPFNPVTTLRFDLPVAAHVTLTLYNSLGQRVARLLDKQMPAGTHTTLWNGRSSSGATLASGVYLARLEIVAPHSARLTATTKMILLK